MEDLRGGDFDVIPVGRADVEREVFSFRFQCQPARCRGKTMCCEAFEIECTSREVARIAGLMGDIVAYAPWLVVDGAFDNPFEPEGRRFVIEQRESGACPFLFRANDGVHLCAIHAAAQARGMDPSKAKPAVCSLWPLCLERQANGRPLLMVQTGGFACPCLSGSADAPLALVSQRGALSAALGSRWYGKLTDTARALGYL